MKNCRMLVCCLVAALLLTAALSGCGNRNEAPAAEPVPTAAPEVVTEPFPSVFENGGLTLTVPAEYADLVEVELDKGGLLFSVSEIASVEAAKAIRPDYYEGAGWLFGISRVTEEELHKMLTEDMSGQSVFARGTDGLLYILNTPTDVRIERSGQITDADIAQWGALCAWAGSMGDRFAEENGLVPCRFGNTEADIHLARIAWGGETGYVLTGLAHGTLSPGADDAAYAAEILSKTAFRYADGEEAPDGEYIIINFPEEATRFDFFLGGDGSYCRQVGSGYEVLYRCDPAFNVTEVVSRWYDALAANAADTAAPRDQLNAYDAAVQAVLDEFAALTLDELYDYDEAAHPELPWYTGIIANRERNDLYYGFYDFDGNGVPELVIAAGDDSYQAPEAVYAFDGTKMVYLCKEQALGERATLSVMPDGTFVVRGSSGAAAGVCAIYRIAADGYSTDLLEVMDYEFSEDGTVTYTPQLGNMTPEEFIAGNYTDAQTPELTYALFAARIG